MTLTIELKPEVMDRLNRKAAEQQRPVATVVEEILTEASSNAASPDMTPADQAAREQTVRDVMNFGRRHGISGEGFDVVAAQHEGHRF
jgi:hypothetical protein